MRNSWIVITFIVILGAVLRLWNIGGVPPHLTPDEASLGYNAYSILKTGRDEHGQFLPVIFKSFGDYKPGLYVYLTVPFVAVMGLGDASVRLPSALMGVLAIYLVYKISNKLFKKDRVVGLLAAFMVAVNPWSVHFSRGAWEANVALTMTLLGVFFFLKAQGSGKYLYLSAASFGMSVIAYQGAKLSSAIVVLLLLLIYWREFVRIDRKIVIRSGTLGLVVSLPIILSFFSGQTGRLGVFSVFSNVRSEEFKLSFFGEVGVNEGSFIYNLFYSEPLNFLRGIMGRYYNHFSGRFLFFEGDWQNPRHSAPYHGMMLLGDIVLIVVGVAFSIKKLSRGHVFVLAWLLLSPLPAVLSRDQVHSVRAMNMLVPLVMLSAIGGWYLWNFLRKVKPVFYIGVFMYALGLIYFLDMYFVHLSRRDSKLWEYGYKQIVEIVTAIQGDYDSIKVQQSFAQPYIYFLFYQKFDPWEYQQINSFTEGDLGDVGMVDRVGSVHFVPIDWSQDRGDVRVLFVSDPLRIPAVDMDVEEHEVVGEIKYLDGSEAFRLVGVHEKDDEK